MNVMWSDWSPEVFARAGAENKPILLSLVAAWSDECAAMDRTTYADSRVASVINDRFVAIRVDADRRPDLNDRYNLGGWPSTVFLTARGEVLSGGTYFDAERMSAMLCEIADAYRDRAAEIRARAAAVRGDCDHAHRHVPDADSDSAAYFRSLLLSRFDSVHGGFGSAPKLPHTDALMFALSMAGDGDAELASVAGDTLHHMRRLWDAEQGGFFRYADAPDWSSAGSGKTLEDNAALLHAYIEGALRLDEAEWLDQSAAIVRWVKAWMSNEALGGFFNAASSGARDKTMYVDKNAMMIGAFIRAAALFDDIWLRDFALRSLEAVVVPAYTPGNGVAHLAAADGGDTIHGLLTDQVHVASALIWSHAATGELPYSMLAAEVLQFAIRTMWDDSLGGFRDRSASDDPVMPFELNCHAACVLDRLAILTGDSSYQDRARTILRSLAPAYRAYDLFGAPYAVAAREVFDRRPPAGLELAPVDWKL